MEDSLTNKTVKSSMWSILDIGFRQGASFIISVVLARLLLPSDYGTIGMLMIFITISNVFIDSGFASGLIRKLDKTQEDLNTAFFFNIAVAIGVYLLLFWGSPLIANFFNNKDIALYLRVLGVVIVINSFNLVQNAILISSLRTKQLTIISAISQTLTGVVAIVLAYCNWGIWALILQQLCASLFQCILLSFSTHWKPTFSLSRKSFNYLWGYGSKLLTANLLGTAFSQAYAFIIGKFIGKYDLGLYTRADQFAAQPESIINNIINKSLMPSLAVCQNNLERLKKNYIKCLELISFIIFPLMFTLGFASRPIFRILFGEKWDDAVPLFRILCFGYAVDIFSLVSLNVIQVLGRTDFTLKLELFKKPIYALVIGLTILGGLKTIVIGKAIYCLVAALVNMIVVKKILRYSYYRQLIDIFKYALLSIIILYPSYILIQCSIANDFLVLLVYVLVGNLIYFLLAFILKMKALLYIKQLLK